MWVPGEIRDDMLVLDMSNESAAVALRPMDLDDTAVKQLMDVLNRPSRSTVIPRDLPSA